MENCTSMGNHSHTEPHFGCGARSRGGQNMHFWVFAWRLHRSGASWYAPQGLRRNSDTPYELNLTRSVIGGPSPRGEPPTGSLRV